MYIDICERGESVRYCLFIILLAVGLCASNEGVVLQLQWKHQFQFAGFYIAKEHGFYRDAGLDVAIKEFDNSIDIIEDVVSQKATYGVAHSSLLISKNKGKPVVALSAIYQSSPYVLIATNPEIKTPHDLHGKRVMVTDDAVQSASNMGMLLSNGISKSDIIMQIHSFDIEDLIDAKTDAMACYLSNEPYYLQNRGIPYTIFNPQEYGFDFYDDIVFTSQKEIETHPQRVKAFQEASTKGWLWAFENIEATAKLIYEKYNTQNKSLENLIYEGKVLKDLALKGDMPFGHISKNRYEEIAKIYRLNGLLDRNYSLDGFINPLGLNLQNVRIGVLAKRGDEVAHKRWDNLAQYLNKRLDTYNFSIVPLDFTEIVQAVKNKSVDFIITNTMQYVQLERSYGISRIATLVNSDSENKYKLKEFGSVIFTRSDNEKVQSLEDLEGVSFGAVSPLSFGGWIIAYEELLSHGIDKEDLQLSYFETHDEVVREVLSSKIDAGAVRTDTLEHMAAEGLIDLGDIKVLAPKKYDNFPYLVSTKLYPEWPIAKLKETSDVLANRVFSEVISFSLKSDLAQKEGIDSWSVPQDYSSVHEVLKKLKIDPYDKSEITIANILREYALYFYIFGLLSVVLFGWILHIKRRSRDLKKFNERLDKEVVERTKELHAANEKLKVLANTDFLTGISNRGYFMRVAQKYFDIAKRNGTTLQVLSLDLDYFKNVNDTYGHQAGDDILKAFAKTITLLLRESDLFGRIGGEEFCIILQNTSFEGAATFAKRVCESIEKMEVTSGEHVIHVTVSIGLATMNDEESIEKLIKKSDTALYMAKESGRNRVYVMENHG
jgi:diguanylate cyclase (GGDEF)-like protein